MIDKIVAEMPKVSINDISEDDQVEFGIYPHAVEIIVEAQCQLLAEQGYRKVPSIDDCFYFVSDKLMASMDLIICKEIAKKLHRWLLEGE